MTSDLIPAFRDWMRAENFSPRTRDSYADLVARTDAELPYGIERALEAELVRWFGYDTDGAERIWSANTRRTYYDALSCFYQWATRPGKELLSYNPLAGIRRPKADHGLPRVPAEEHVRAILAGTSDPVRTLALIATYSGLRCIELARLDRRDITEQTLTVRKGKGNRGRAIKTHAEVWRAVRHLPDGLVVEHVGGRADERWISRTCWGAFRRAGAPTSMHRLRVRLATMLRAAGYDLDVVQEILGHASIETTRIHYARVPDGECRQAIDSLPVVDAAA